MKIDVGTQARVVGTKKVSPKGTVAGLAEFAGRDVLVVVPSQTPRYVTTASDLLTQARTEVRRQGKAALKGYRTLRLRYLRQQTPVAGRLLGVSPERARPTIKKADAWVRASAERLEKGAERLLAN